MQRRDFRGRGGGGNNYGGDRGSYRGDSGGGRNDSGGGHGRGGSYHGGGGRGGGGGYGSGERSGSGYRGRGGGERGRGRGRGRGVSEPTGPIIFTPSQPGPHLADLQITAAGDRLVESFKTKKYNDELPLRPGFGKAGVPISIRANHFAIEIPKGPFYEYKITFQPEVKIKRVRQRLLEILDAAPVFAQYQPFTAHDGSEKLIAAKKLPEPHNGTLDVQVKLFDKDDGGPGANSKEYLISLSFTGEITASNINDYLDGSRSFNIAPLLSALNIILAKCASNAGVKVGTDRYFFKEARRDMDLDGGLEAWMGFYSSVRPTVDRLMVNLNVCYTAFYKERNLAAALDEFSRASHNADASKFIEGVRVQTTHLSYRPKKTVRRLHRNAESIDFVCAEFGNRKINVKQYFERKYRIVIPKSHWVVDLGTKDKPNFVPAELCEILPNQAFKGKLADYNTTKMIGYACKAPIHNANSIVGQGIPLLGFNSPTNKTLDEFKVSINPNMAVIPARVLSPPRLVYSQNQSATIDPAKASWNLANRKFYKGVSLINWGIFVVRNGGRDDIIDTGDPALAYLKQQFEGICTKSGMSTQPCAEPVICDLKASTKPIPDVLAGDLERLKGMDFVLVILSAGDKHIYAAVRHICDIKLGIPATCVQVGKIKKAGPQYIANVASKVNAKLGGINHVLDKDSASWLNRELTMLVGMDVTHPGPGSINGTPSIAAVVASYDPDHVMYPASLRFQESRKEMIEDLSQMMSERLRLFRDKRGEFPTRIIVFRDGVSEGQFPTVLKEEYPKILDAFQSVSTKAPGFKYQPKLTIIICGKRHHTRFFPMDDNLADQLGNPKPGTVVDRGVTAVYDYDFFLQAHAGLKGSARPTHYTVIYDQNKLDADHVQRLINDTSYTFARATKAVSLVPPAYYADLACERGRYYLHELFVGTAGQTGGTPDVEQAAARSWGEGIHKKIKDTMFYI